MLLKAILSGLMIGIVCLADPTSVARVSVIGLVKNKKKEIADARFQQNKSGLNLVFDSEHLSPGSYQLEIKLDCKNKSPSWIIGEFKTQSGYVSTEFVHTNEKTKMDVFNLEKPRYLALIKKGKKQQTLSCTEIKVQDLPVQAESSEIFN